MSSFILYGQNFSENRSQSTNVIITDYIDDIKSCLSIMNDKIDELSKFKIVITEVLSLVTKLNNIINEKLNEIKDLE